MKTLRPMLRTSILNALLYSLLEPKTRHNEIDASKDTTTDVGKKKQSDARQS